MDQRFAASRTIEASLQEGSLSLSFFDSPEYVAAVRQDLQSIPQDPTVENKFFEAHCFINQSIIEGKYEQCATAWRKVLSSIASADPRRYGSIHKGTPYYFISVSAYLAEDFERALFFMDSAVAEDFTNFPSDWHRLPAGLFLQLDDKNPEQFAQQLTMKTRRVLEEHLGDYENQTGDSFKLPDLRDRFFKPAITGTHAWRSAATALVTFVLEFETRRYDLTLRSAHGGSNEPFFLHLFKGSLVFETLLKVCPYGSTLDAKTLGDLLADSIIKKELGLPGNFQGMGQKTFSEVIQRVEQSVAESEPLVARAVRATWGIRNTTGHSLSWADTITQGQYQMLFEHLLFSSFRVISRLFV